MLSGKEWNYGSDPALRTGYTAFRPPSGLTLCAGPLRAAVSTVFGSILEILGRKERLFRGAEQESLEAILANQSFVSVFHRLSGGKPPQLLGYPTFLLGLGPVR